MSSLTKALARRALLVYPRAWRLRYADEVSAVLEHGVSFRDVTDLARGSLDAWWTEIASRAWAPPLATKVIVAYVLLQLVAFAALRVAAGPGRFDVGAVWALEYSAGYVVLCHVLGRRRPSKPA